jgi:hypothetical protein
MNDHATCSDDSAPMNLSVDGHSVEGHVRPDGRELEERVQRLEEAVESLKDTTALEERIVLRVTERLTKAPSSDKVVAGPPPSPPPPLDGVGRVRGSHAWLFYDMIADARLMVIMLLDRRYAMAWTTHMVVWLFIPAILLSSWWFPLSYLPLVGHYLDKILDLLLAFCVYKALSRETRRYREIVDRGR